MIKKKDHEKILLVDIETASQYANYEELRSIDPVLASHWDRRHIYYSGNYFEYQNTDPSVTYKDKAALEPEFGKIVCITFGSWTPGSSGELRLMSLHGEESEILQKTKKILQNAMIMSFLLTGHNIKNFDIPWIAKRMIYNGINPPDYIRVGTKKPWELPYIDTSDLFSFGSWAQQKSLSLDLLCHSIGVQSPKGSMHGSQVSESFHSGRIEEIIKYCEMDVRALYDIIMKISE
jgi:DNA polymerase elongation subunit (family B)